MFLKRNLYVVMMILFSCEFAQAVSMQTFSIPGKQTQIVIQRGDITKSKVDVIVNAANQQLAGGGGVCGAIFAAAGASELQAACNKFPIVQQKDSIRCLTGQAVRTDSFALKSQGIKYIIHAVGPDCRIIKNLKEQETLLKSVYMTSLKLTENLHVKSIAFPFISSAIYACPRQTAAKVAVTAVFDYIKTGQHGSLQSVHFVLFSAEDFDFFCSTARKIIDPTFARAVEQTMLERFIEKIKKYWNNW